MTESIKIIFIILGISSAFLLFSLGLMIGIAPSDDDKVEGFGFGMLFASLCTFIPSLVFILWYYGILAS